MKEYIIYHNPRCSKSRQTLQLLRLAGIEPTIIEYLKTPPKKDELKKELLKIAPEILKFSQPVWLKIDQFKRQKKQILFEGAQGILLDVDHGT